MGFRRQKLQTTTTCGSRTQTSASIQRQTTRAARNRIQIRQIPQRFKENGTLEGTRSDRSADKDLVPEPKNEVEEAVDVSVENRTASRIVPGTIVRTQPSSIFPFESLRIRTSQLRLHTRNFTIDTMNTFFSSTSKAENLLKFSYCFNYNQY